MTSLGCHLVGFAPPHANPWGLTTTLLGVAARVAREIPDPDKIYREKFFRFVGDELIPSMFVPLDMHHDISHNTWIHSRPYPKWRKDQLIQIFEKNENKTASKKIINKCFMKDETYQQFKHSRGIYSKEDWFKNIAGPLASACESVVFDHPVFIKHVPVLLRPGLLFKTLFCPGAKYVTSDYTAYESHFTEDVMRNVEFKLYRYLLQNVPGALNTLDFVEDAIVGRQECYFKNFKFSVNASRMSGEMFTSIGNGFTNYALMAFAAKEHGTQLKGFVEGDDGIFTFENNIVPESDYFERLGFTIKMETHAELNKASFCGNLFDVDDLIVVTDPREVLLNFGWSKTPHVSYGKIKLQELLKSKSMSFAYQYRGCPIIQSLAHYGLRLTKRIDLRRYLEKDRSISLWEREQILEALENQKEIYKVEPPIKTRILIEELYGLTIEEQHKIEEYFDNLETLQPIKLSIFDQLFHADCSIYYNYYVDEGAGARCGNLGRDATWFDYYRDHIKFHDAFSNLGYTLNNLT
jgi:hypothetical protein